MSADNEKVCCNCRHDIRIKDNDGMVVRNECDIDDHYIGYVECMEGWCRHWVREREGEE
ncbi:MAG: hypothetical protein LIO86_09790 [Lachnospiraceae bacterium]|nr:hypothetical protein [Lachnospiraceae bacterium]